VPGERPPIKAIALFLGKVSQSVATAPCEIILMLVGHKEGSEFGAVGKDAFMYWRNLVDIGAPRVSLETWATK